MPCKSLVARSENRTQDEAKSMEENNSLITVFAFVAELYITMLRYL